VLKKREAAAESR
jgi:hypothetical protein